MPTRPHFRYLNRIHRQERLLPYTILHFNTESRDLQAWFWPITQTGERVPPSDFDGYRVNYDFRAPCCLCANDAVGGRYTESAVFLALDGKYTGEYVAGCASDTCGYIVAIERMYTRRGLLVERYPLREYRQPALPLVRRLLGGEQLAQDLSVARLIGNAPLPSIQPFEQPSRGSQATLDRLLRLDSWANPGLSEADFRDLFAMCRCGLVATRRVFRGHICAPKPAPVIIDLTIDTDEGPVVIDLTGDSEDN